MSTIGELQQAISEASTHLSAIDNETKRRNDAARLGCASGPPVALDLDAARASAAKVKSLYERACIEQPAQAHALRGPSLNVPIGMIAALERAAQLAPVSPAPAPASKLNGATMTLTQIAQFYGKPEFNRLSDEHEKANPIVRGPADLVAASAGAPNRMAGYAASHRARETEIESFGAAELAKWRASEAAKAGGQ